MLPVRRTPDRTQRESEGGIFVRTRVVITFCILTSLIVLTSVGSSIYFSLVQCQMNDLDSVSIDQAKEPPTVWRIPDLLEDIRLPRSLFPRHYTIRLLPWMEEDNFTINGDISILIDCVEKTNLIVLHNVGNIIEEQSIKVTEDMTQQNVRIENFSEDFDRQFINIQLGTYLEPGSSYTLSMKFIGMLDDQHRGFYRISYLEDSEKKYVATTQMEPVDARRAFPCFDEPDFKSSFSIVLGRKANMTSLSNMPKKMSSPISGVPGYVWDYYEPSLKMSTYLVAMVIADFSYAESTIDSNVTLRVWARHSAINQTKYAVEMGPKILQFFQDYFGIDYPLPKQDMIALPGFPGAMENWGLITYGETHLLYDESVSFQRELVAQVIAHEQAHQWFGNLVTMQWWDELWLNEGFASYLSYLAANHFEPDYRLCQQFVINELQAVMGVDGLTTSHPIHQKVHHPNEISQIFDRISYNKGATVIRMLAELLSAETFRSGLSLYLKSKMYGNTVEGELWAALDSAAQEDSVQLPADIKTIMNSWTLKMGFPVVTIVRNYSSQTAIATQERFLLDTRSTTAEKYLWWVPLTYTAQENPELVRCEWIPESEQIEISLESNEDEWVLFNVEQQGYYRVNYDEKNWALIIGQLLEDPRPISVVNRAQLIDDAFNLARVGRLSYSTALDLTSFLQTEVDYVPWKAMETALRFFDAMLSRTPAYGDFQFYVNNMLNRLFLHVSDNLFGDEPLRVYTQALAFKLACYFKHRDCIRNATALFLDWIENPSLEQVVPSYLRSTVACTAVSQGGQREWDFVYFKFSHSNTATEKEDMLEAMSCSNEVWIIHRMLEKTLDGSLGNLDSVNLLMYLFQKKNSRHLAFDFFKSNWKALMSSQLSGVPTAISVFDVATESFNTQKELDEIKQFFSEVGQGPASRTFEQVLEKIEANILWINRSYETIARWLEENRKRTVLNYDTINNAITF